MNRINGIKWDLSKHGDPLEQEYYNYLTETLKPYIDIWEKFIGNVHNYPPKVNGLTSQQEEDRYKIAELNYTILENLVSLKEILYEYNNIETDNKRIIKANRDIKTIFSTTSNIFDCLEHILIIIKTDKGGIEKTYTQLKDYVLDRNRTLHDKKIPINISDGILYIPKQIGKEIEDKVNKKWNEYSSLDFIPLYDYLSKMIKETEFVVYSVLHKEFTVLNNEFKNLKFNNINHSELNTTQLSGLTQSYISINMTFDNLRKK